MARRGLVLALALAILAATATPTEAQQSRRYVAPPTAAEATLPPFSGAVRVGNTRNTSGDLPEHEMRVNKVAVCGSAPLRGGCGGPARVRPG